MYWFLHRVSSGFLHHRTLHYANNKMHEQTDSNPADTNQYSEWRAHHIVPHNTTPSTHPPRQGAQSTYISRTLKTPHINRHPLWQQLYHSLWWKKGHNIWQNNETNGHAGTQRPKTTLYMINMTAPLREMTEQHIPDTFKANHVYECYKMTW